MFKKLFAWLAGAGAAIGLAPVDLLLGAVVGAIVLAFGIIVYVKDYGTKVRTGDKAEPETAPGKSDEECIADALRFDDSQPTGAIGELRRDAQGRLEAARAVGDVLAQKVAKARLKNLTAREEHESPPEPLPSTG